MFVMMQRPFRCLSVSSIQFPHVKQIDVFSPLSIVISWKARSHHRHTDRQAQTLPGRVSPAFRAQGADIVSVQQKSGGSGTSEQRQQADVALGGQESGKAAGHGGHREEGRTGGPETLMKGF